MAFEKPYIYVVGEAHLTNTMLDITHALMIKSLQNVGSSVNFLLDSFRKVLGESKTANLIELSKTITLAAFDQMMLQANDILIEECRIAKSVDPDIILLERPEEEGAICEQFNNREISAEKLVDSLYGINAALNALKNYGVFLQDALGGSVERLEALVKTLKNYHIGLANMFSRRDDLLVHAIDIPNREKRMRSLDENGRATLDREREGYMAMRADEIANAEEPQVMLIIVGRAHQGNVEGLLKEDFSYGEDHIIDMPLDLGSFEAVELD